MPPKIRELIAELERAGFIDRGGKGSHRNYEHHAGYRITISGNLGADAEKYQEKLVKRALREVKNK
jgi:predicted RNA binding protein YcfA (HicA-like mRNA interferase family)